MLDEGSAATLVHAFVTSRIDYCNAVYAGAPKTITDILRLHQQAIIKQTLSN